MRLTMARVDEAPTTYHGVSAMEYLGIKVTLTHEEEKEIKDFFMKYDTDDNGMLDLEELQKLFANFNIVALQVFN